MTQNEQTSTSSHGLRTLAATFENVKCMRFGEPF